jgi:predicted nuclease of restriction endonuclease-like RecB superfamily
MCRKCRAQPETLGHILRQCTSTKSQRIRRHDEIKDLILDKVNITVADATITREPTIELPNGGKLKPDMVIKNHEGVFVVDVTVRHEDGDYLVKGRLNKREKYAPLLPILRERVATTSAEVLPVVIGRRGAMPAESVETLRRIGIKDRKTLFTISLIALRSSIELYHAFMDFDRAPNAGVAPPKNVK